MVICLRMVRLAAGAARCEKRLGSRPDAQTAAGRGCARRIKPFWYVEGCSRAWLDQQNDVTVKDVKLSHQEGFRSVEHLKRYTTLGMATDQGKTSNMGGLAIMAELAGKTIPEVGTTIFRPPYTPTAIGVLAGRHRGQEFHPKRLTPSHKWAEEQGAVFVEVGNWLRAQWFPRAGETTWRESVDREVLATRKSVGVCDVTTLGKVDVQGTDAAAFLNKIYCNGFRQTGRRQDPLWPDAARRRHRDGRRHRRASGRGSFRCHNHHCQRPARLPPHGIRAPMPVPRHGRAADFHHRSMGAICRRRPELPRAVAKDRGSEDLSNEAFPFMACANITVCGGLRARLFRISFSGELAYEIAVPTAYGDALIRKIMEAGAEFDVTPYGTEALGVMRIEKGHAAGNELNGTTTAQNLGMGRMVSKTKDSIGSSLSEREGLNAADDLRQVGIKPVNLLTLFLLARI